MVYLRSITIKVDLLAGTDIQRACADLCELAGRVGCLIEANFNGVLIWARAGDSPGSLADAYHEAIKSGNSYKIATAKRHKEEPID